LGEIKQGDIKMAATSKSTRSNGNSNPAVEDIAAHAARIREDLAALGEALAGAGAVQSGVARDAAETKIDELLKNGEKVVADLSNHYSRAEQQVSTKVRDNPLQALGVAVAAGFFAALLMRR
jgi:ElaB/YqjD/DUF883 family membrane-anchored ribosome-binding protein